MVEYLKGEVCGVDNCRVTQYYLEDGQLFCRNGHRKEVEPVSHRVFEFNVDILVGSTASSRGRRYFWNSRTQDAKEG